MKWTIRNGIVCPVYHDDYRYLTFSGFQGVYSYRRLARSISQRAEETRSLKTDCQTKQLNDSFVRIKQNSMELQRLPSF